MKPKHSVNSIARVAVQIVFFVFFPAAFSVAFSGIRYVAEQIQRHEGISWNPFLFALVGLLAFTCVFGRFFCGYACAFGSLGDWLFAGSAFVQRRLRKKVFRLPDKVIAALLYVKYAVLAAIVVACVAGVYASVSGADPWGVFALIRAGNFSLAGREWAVAALGVIAVGMLFVERFFCMFLCPMGAVFDLLPMLPATTFNRVPEKCAKGCSLCTRACPAALSLGEGYGRHGECFQCGKCAAKCPTGSMRIGLRRLKGTEAWLTAAKAAVLFALCYKAIGM
ncbi:MAG: 4Fe-4S binding protein [Clostridiales Family XIII bacterium]|jgi:polyferredoxin|nr:4Fe-4S binding protein [Clostridiales Family XIII bacterium]